MVGEKKSPRVTSATDDTQTAPLPPSKSNAAFESTKQLLNHFVPLGIRASEPIEKSNRKKETKEEEEEEEEDEGLVFCVSVPDAKCF